MKCFPFMCSISDRKKIVNTIHLNIKKNFFKPFLLLALVSMYASTAFAQADGAKLFKSNCATCHTIGKGKLTGPDLKDVATRVPQPADEWLHKWIKNNRAVMASGDAYGIKVYNEYSKQAMTVFDGVISDEEITAIIAYMKNPPVEKKPEGGEVLVEAKQEEGFSPIYLLAIAGIILLIVISVLGNVKRNLQNTVNSKNGLPPAEPIGLVKWASQNKRWVAFITLILVIVVLRLTYIGLMNISVYSEYHPEQPIKFSHQTHADKLKINCVYCHSGAEKGKVSGVPSANVCMNCHMAVSEGPKTGKAEIAKIYEAVGWNPEKGVYDKPQKPIEWVRVHSLPDFVYFNHSQHVVVGKQDCKNCHGEVEKMDEVKQVSSLTMAWCIDCHRKTEVPGMSSNPYYENLHAKLKEKYKGVPITVEKIGGLDCIKCHY
ncbi:MAG TPA: c-type cytochrome [Bacteroidia bacterium]|nr:c-type cytochrome [Bacteroidia bacterium]